MEFTKTHKIVVSIIVVVILLGIYITVDRKSREKLDNNSDISQFSTTTDSTASTTVLSNQISGGTYKIEQIPATTGKKIIPQPIPDLDRQVIKSPLAKNISDSDVSSASTKIKEMQTLLKKDPSYFGAWLDLAMQQKAAGDYDGAIISWKYAGILVPTDFISRGNLGNFYAYYLKDNAMAETYYKEAIARGSTQEYLYTQLADVYREVFQDLDKARAIVAEGLTKLPNNPNLLQLQESLKAQ